VPLVEIFSRTPTLPRSRSEGRAVACDRQAQFISDIVAIATIGVEKFPSVGTKGGTGRPDQPIANELTATRETER